ncbi:DUF2723 domain-containing protein [Patescibacteria group bacterium]|nr:DUF2723 domain-containing protein [Patescibacteria group bacterium]MCL5091855.1 DUF2723 domain-containing protein [Patescibacteria group bacterium]
MIDYCLIAVVGLANLLLQTRFLFGGDSSEYVLTAQTWSIPHPPGYPLYSFLINLIRICLPVYTVAWRVALLSSLPTIASALLIYWLAHYFLKRRLPALAAAFLYLVLFPVWQYSLVPEVFALNNLFILLITALIVKYQHRPHSRYLSLICIGLGLALVHHQSIIFFLPAWYGLLRHRPPPRWRHRYLLFFLMGLAFYLYVPLAASRHPLIDWENAATISGFFRLITRSSYGTFAAFSGSVPNLFNQLINVFSLLIFIIKDFRLIGIVFILLGLNRIRKFQPALFRFLVIALIAQLFFIFLLNFWLSASFSLAIYERFLLATYTILPIPFAFGVAEFTDLMDRTAKRWLHSLDLRRLVAGGSRLFVVLFIIIVAATNFPSIRQLASDRRFETVARSLLSSLPKNALVYLQNDSLYFTANYLNTQEKIRPDVHLLTIQMLSRDYYRQRLHRELPDLYLPPVTSHMVYDFLQKNSRHFPIFFEIPGLKDYWLPYGLVWKYYPSVNAAQSDIKTALAFNYRYWTTQLPKPLDPAAEKILFLNDLQSTVADMYRQFGEMLVLQKQYAPAEAIFKQILSGYQSGNNDIYLSLLKLNLAKNNCVKAKLYLEKLRPENSLNQTKERLLYYHQCDHNNPEIYRFLEQYNRLKSGSSGAADDN